MEKQPEDLEKVLKKEWTVSALDRETNKFVTATNQSYEYVNKGDMFVPATPANITYSDHEPVERDYESIVAFGDTQIGYREVLDHETGATERIALHDERAMKVARYILRDLRPDIIVNLGDTIDLSSLSRFKADSDHFMRELGPAFQRVHDMYAELRADNPDAEIVEVASNHNQRFVDTVLKQFPQMYGVRRAGEDSEYPVMSYPYLANLAHVNVKWLGGYPAGEYLYGEEGHHQIAFRHGTETSSNGTTASKIMKNNPETHNVQGHSHEMGEAWHTLRDGKSLGSFAVGALCRTDGVVPGFHTAVNDHNLPVHRQEQWQQSLLHIKSYGGGEYEFQPIRIQDGKAYFNGQLYEAQCIIKT